MNILVDHGYGHNMGDAAMLDGVLQKISSIAPEASLFVPDHSDIKKTFHHIKQLIVLNDFTLNIQHLPYVWRWERPVLNSLFLSVRILNRASSLGIRYKDNNTISLTLGDFCRQFDALHIAGGGFLTDIFFSVFIKKLCLISTFIEQNKPVILTGQQLGPFQSFLSKTNLAEVIKKVQFLGLRDPVYSMDFCRQAGMKNENFALMGDDSFGLDVKERREADNALESMGVKPNAFIAFNIRLADYLQITGEQVRAAGMLLSALSKELKMPVLIVPIEFGNKNSCLKAGENFLECYPGGEIKLFNPQETSPALLKGVIAKAFAALGVSYHFCTFALSSGVPAVCLYQGDYYKQKAQTLSSFWGEEKILLSLGQLSEGNMDLALKQTVNFFKEVSFREGLAEKAARAAEKWHAVFDTQLRKYYGYLGTDHHL
jgi:polysaccharide pyruvyl transferase WcaK-like protein